MEFIDREREQRLLTSALQSSRPAFIVLYGRRRLGKSTLLRRVLGPRDVYFEASMSEKATQISLLARTIAMSHEGFDKPVYPDWHDIIMAFNYRCQDNATLVLDEFPYMVQRDPSLPSTLQNILDRRIIGGEGLRCNIVVCGSSQRMMQRLMQGSEPLYGRAEHVINLRPIRLPHWQQVLHGTAKQLVEEYSVWGGVPQYWSLREQYRTLDDAIGELVLSELGVLYQEPSRLFMDDTTDIASYSSIMMVVGGGRHRLSNIADAMGRSMAELAKPMRNLVEMSMLRREVPFGESDKKSRKTLYQIDDPFMAFYYRFVEPNKSIIAMGHLAIAKRLLDQGFAMHVAGVWERLCQVAVSGSTLGGHVWGVASRWWGKVPVYEPGRKTPSGSEDLEFDVVAEDMDAPGTLLVGECKWMASDYADRLLEKLRRKVSLAPFAQGRRVVYALFLREPPLSLAQDCMVLLPADVLRLLSDGECSVPMGQDYLP